MKKPTQEEIMKKWAPILGSMGMTGSQLDNLSQLAENQSNQILEENTSGDFPTLLPLAMKVAAKTIATDLIFASKEEIDEALGLTLGLVASSPGLLSLLGKGVNAVSSIFQKDKK